MMAPTVRGYAKVWETMRIRTGDPIELINRYISREFKWVCLRPDASSAHLREFAADDKNMPHDVVCGCLVPPFGFAGRLDISAELPTQFGKYFGDSDPRSKMGNDGTIR